ncbi:MAG TPA: hypothetical protein PL012_14475 [Candidatus Obscuribacter sp.]|nr:hypothetical protein [Candidatus Obscuribacter sp.]
MKLARVGEWELVFKRPARLFVFILVVLSLGSSIAPACGKSIYDRKLRPWLKPSMTHWQWLGACSAGLSSRWRDVPASKTGKALTYSFKLDSHGRVLDLKLVTSSGDAVKDEAAESLIREFFADESLFEAAPPIPKSNSERLKIGNETKAKTWSIAIWACRQKGFLVEFKNPTHVWMNSLD